MKIGVIGSGNIGGRVGRLWAEVGHEVLFSGGKETAKLNELVDSIDSHARAGTPQEAVAYGDVIFFSVPFVVAQEVLAGLGSLEGKILIDSTNPYSFADGKLSVLDVRAGQKIAEWAQGARVVKAYNTLPAAHFTADSREVGSTQIALFLCGDDAEAKEVVRGLILDSGFGPVDIGPLSNVAYQEPNGALYGKPMSVADAQAAVAKAGL